MTFEYVLTYLDYKDSQKLYLRHRPAAASFYYFYVWFLPIAGLLASVPFIAGMCGFRPEWKTSFAGLGGVGLWLAIYIPVMRLYAKRRCWKQLIPDDTQNKSIKTTIPCTLEFNDNQIISAVSGRSEGRFFWVAILDFVENDKVALLFIQKKKFIVVPKRAMTETAWAELRSLVSSKIRSS